MTRVVLCLSFCLTVAFGFNYDRMAGDKLVSHFRQGIQFSKHAINPPTRWIPTLNQNPVHSESEKQDLASESDLLKAEAHFLEMRFSTGCSAPSPRVVCVRDHYPDKKNLKPGCTILHRCDSGSGCCEDPRLSCQSADSEMVSLKFLTEENSVLNLIFTNHTACRCGVHEETQEERWQRPDKKPKVEEYEDETNLEYIDEYDEDTPECKRCPRPFTKRNISTLCTCDCFHNEYSCISIQEGHKSLEDVDRRCIDRGLCTVPTCALGYYYDRDHGTCRKPELEAFKVLIEAEDDLSTSTSKPVKRLRSKKSKSFKKKPASE